MVTIENVETQRISRAKGIARHGISRMIERAAEGAGFLGARSPPGTVAGDLYPAKKASETTKMTKRHRPIPRRNDGLSYYPRVVAVDKDLKVFISWSGTLAKEVTNVLREWLPKMFDNINPWASDVDIVAGTRGFDEIKKALDDSGFGIIVITTENMEKPWLNFEAGALSKRLDGDPERVVPLLVNFDNPYQLKTPVGQFQAVMLDEDGMRRLCKAIASSMGLPLSAIIARFEWAWPDLAKSIEAAKERAGDQPEPPPLNEMDLLKQLIARVDTLQRTESTPQTAPNRRKSSTRGALDVDALAKILEKHGILDDAAVLRDSGTLGRQLRLEFSAAHRTNLRDLELDLAALGIGLYVAEPD